MDEGLDSILRETLVALFRGHPDRFVLIGGAALHVVYGSPRESADADLLAASPVGRAELSRISRRLEQALKPAAAHLGVSLGCRPAGSGDAIIVRRDSRPLLTVQFPRLPGFTRRENRLVVADSLGPELIAVPDPDGLLFSKLVALLKRPRLKGRDVFDIWFLAERGARLRSDAFSDWLKWEELGSGEIAARLALATPERLERDLAPFLPEELHERLKADGYSALLGRVRGVLAEFL